MKIKEILEKLDSENNYIGFQLSKRNGLINTTWLLYKKDLAYYFFDINQKIEFEDNYKYSTIELLNELEKASFEIELSIN
ncbi:hypothetical protein SAMN03080594_106232 [Arenibacter palladensis]|uniref:Uncharacterized protein n=1 Tax=Arenibacter palladensis TaxID=237373 RepID=A0A1M5DT40_9FLAO|nr:hypothetical protein [Arenibacter palladensis]SHF70110.1 hypothetical protein SAMN03080594_106232 [Arenibacter palladensis]